jgi:hypothetical protein
MSCHVVDDPQTYLGIFPFDIEGISDYDDASREDLDRLT